METKKNNNENKQKNLFLLRYIFDLLHFGSGSYFSFLSPCYFFRLNCPIRFSFGVQCKNCFFLPSHLQSIVGNIFFFARRASSNKSNEKWNGFHWVSAMKCVCVAKCSVNVVCIPNARGSLSWEKVYKRTNEIQKWQDQKWLVSYI